MSIVSGLQESEIEKTQVNRRGQSPNSPKGVVLLIDGILRETETQRAINRHHYHPPRRELHPGQQGQREDRADDPHRRPGLSGAAVPSDEPSATANDPGTESLWVFEASTWTAVNSVRLEPRMASKTMLRG